MEGTSEDIIFVFGHKPSILSPDILGYGISYEDRETPRSQNIVKETHHAGYEFRFLTLPWDPWK